MGRTLTSESPDRAEHSTDAVAGAAQLACILEVSAPKAGNIGPESDFVGTTFEDMLRSAIAVGPALAEAGRRGLGATVLACVRATRRVSGSNTNLGIVLLISPLARAALAPGLVAAGLRDRVIEVLSATDVADARDAYAAIRLAAPGGLGEADSQDVGDVPSVTLLAAMEAARDRDRIAAEYASGFEVTFEVAVPLLGRLLGDGLSPRAAASRLHLELLAAFPDTLIARKRGEEAAREVSAAAARALAAGPPGNLAGERAIGELDAWLRAEGNVRNPGTTADLVAAALFVALLEGAL